MKSRLLKLSSVLAAFAFMAVTMFSNQANAETISANDVVVDATYETAPMESVDIHILVYRCFVLGCSIDEESADGIDGN